MRSSAKFIFWILLLSFVGVFLFTQSSGLLGRGPVTPTTAVATVNGTDILYTDWQRRAQQLIQQEQQAGRSLSQDETSRIENQAYDEMVSEILLEQEYRRRGIGVTDDELRDYARYAPPRWVQSAPDLQTEGNFDPAKYQRLLASSQARQSGLLVALEQYFRSEVPKNKLFEQVTSGLYVTDAELWRSWQDANDSASISVVAFHPKPSAADSNVADDDLRKYYDSHKTELDRPAHATLSVIYIPRLVTAADQLAKLAASADQPAKFDAAARQLGLTPFRVQAVEGEPAQHNGKNVPSVSAWAFNNARLGESSDLFDAEDGYYLARLDSLTASGKTFDAVKGEVRARVSAERAVERVLPVANQLATAAKRSSLESAAAAAGQTVVKTGMTTRAGAVPTFGSLGEAIGAAFSLPVNTISTPVRQSDGVFVMRVDARKPADRAAFDAAKNDLRLRRLQSLRQQRVQLFLDDLRKSARIDDRRKELNARMRKQATT